MLDPGLPEGRMAAGWVRAYIDLDWIGAERDYREALLINPNLPDAHASLGWMLNTLGRLDEAESELRKAFQLNPVGDSYGTWLAIVQVARGKYGEALELARSIADQNASPVYAGGKVYFLSNEGETTILEPGDTYQVVAQNKLGERCQASMAVSNGRLFIRTQENLWCIRKAEP